MEYFRTQSELGNVLPGKFPVDQSQLPLDARAYGHCTAQAVAPEIALGNVSRRADMRKQKFQIGGRKSLDDLCVVRIGLGRDHDALVHDGPVGSISAQFVEDGTEIFGIESPTADLHVLVHPRDVPPLDEPVEPVDESRFPENLGQFVEHVRDAIFLHDIQFDVATQNHAGVGHVGIVPDLEIPLFEISFPCTAHLFRICESEGLGLVQGNEIVVGDQPLLPTGDVVEQFGPAHHPAIGKPAETAHFPEEIGFAGDAKPAVTPRNVFADEFEKLALVELSIAVLETLQQPGPGEGRQTQCGQPVRGLEILVNRHFGEVVAQFARP